MLATLEKFIAESARPRIACVRGISVRRKRKVMTHQPNEIWNCGEPLRPWRAQMKNYIAQFATEEQAKRYVAALKKIAERVNKKNTPTKRKA